MCRARIVPVGVIVEAACAAAALSAEMGGFADSEHFNSEGRRPPTAAETPKREARYSATPDRGILKRVLGLGRQCGCTVCLFYCLPAENYIVCLVKVEVPKTDLDFLRCVLGVFDLFFIHDDLRYEGAK